MPRIERWSVSWNRPEGRLEAREPTRVEVEAAATDLSAWYNEAHNRVMMASEEEMGIADVGDHYEGVWQRGGRNFLLYAEGLLMGDADLRRMEAVSQTAEFAIMIGERNTQGRGFGTGFATMLHALAFDKLDLDRIYVSIIPTNHGSLRLFQKLGYVLDSSPAARSYVDRPDDVVMSLGRAAFRQLHAGAISEITIASLG
jgi:RimJ/RimL family protein N-acetyltransferase